MSDSIRELESRLATGCQALGISPSAHQYTLLIGYIELLCKWNKAYNLTAVREPAQMITRHLLDSLAVLPFYHADRCLDVGSGAGLPGVPLAIMRPESEFHLLDSNGKKTRFLFQVKTALALDNMVVHQSRVETFESPAKFKAITSRAFATLSDMYIGCRHLLDASGQCLAMKGAEPSAELKALEDLLAKQNPQDKVSGAVHSLNIPGLDEARHLVTLMPQTTYSL
ncbi:MAG: 16S rRNA (guanine(527)-N(7))-methyltransferase RsmG [Halioglobus sp.]